MRVAACLRLRVSHVREGGREGCERARRRVTSTGEKGEKKRQEQEMRKTRTKREVRQADATMVTTR